MGSLTTAGLPFISLKDIADIKDQTVNVPYALNQLYLSFKNPENVYKPFVRWWLSGDYVQEKEILRELNVMKEAAIGGIEINPIKFPGDTSNLGLKALPWLSDEWISMLHTALKGAKERGLFCDMIVGSGWPFGGEFLSREDQTQMAALGTGTMQKQLMQSNGGTDTWESLFELL